VKNVELDGQKIALQLWDTAGQERYIYVIQYTFSDNHKLKLSVNSPLIQINKSRAFFDGDINFIDSVKAKQSSAESLSTVAQGDTRLCIVDFDA
jgi:GTPase SAR1 family protein